MEIALRSEDDRELAASLFPEAAVLVAPVPKFKLVSPQ
jgi:hypothetical protein